MHNFDKKINSLVVTARQSFQFFRQITWLLRNNKVWSRFRNRILYWSISIIKLEKKTVKANFILKLRESPKDIWANCLGI